MTPRSFPRWPDPRPTTPSAPVDAVDEAVHGVRDEMGAAMRAIPGVGLAAPQIGIVRRLAIVAAGDGRGAARLATSRVVQAGREMRGHEEASPNPPGVSVRIPRSRAVTVARLDEDGAAREGEFVLLRATSVRPQIDHPDGRADFLRLSHPRRDALLRRASRCA